MIVLKKRTCKSFIFIMLAIAVASLTSAVAYAEKVDKIEISGLTTISEKVVRDIITLKVGDEFSFEALDDSLSYLRKWGIFDRIETSPVMTPEGVVVRISLEEAVIVESIDIHGNYPYIENKIRKYLSLYAGDIYTPDRILEQIERLKAFYKRQGFIATEVSVDEEMIPEVNGIALTFYIHRGSVLRYDNITIVGNKAYPDGRFVSKINPIKPYSERRLRESIRDLKEFYHTHGYPRARIWIESKKIDFENRRVDLTVGVDEGPHVVLRFTGAWQTNRKELRKAVTILQEGSIDDFEVEMSSIELRKLFVKKGYPDASVKGSKQKLDDGSIQVTFDIEEGISQKIRLLTFKGNEDVDKSVIAKRMRNKTRSFKRSGAFYPEYTDRDDEAIHEAMKKKGYLDAKVRRWKVRPVSDGYAVDITIPIDPGVQTLVSKIEFPGDIPVKRKKLIKTIKAREGKPFDEPGVEEDRERLLSFLADNGYPYATIDAKWELGEDASNVIITFDIDKGALVTIGRILIVGDVLTSQKAIKSAMSLKEGDEFSYRKVIESQLNIRRLGPFSSVSVTTIGLEDEARIVHLRVKLEEQRPFRIDLGLNYSTDENLTGSLAFSNVNAFGWAKTNTLKLTVGEDLSRAEMAWYDPRFLGSNYEMTTNGWVQYKKQPSYSFVQVGGALGWFRRYKRFGLLFRWELDRNYFITGDSVAADADSLRDNILSTTSLTPSFDSRDNFADPRKGFYTLARADVFNEIKGDEANFFKLTWRGENDSSPFGWVTFSTAFRFSKILTVGHNVSVPTNELLFLGGGDTIRGFSLDSLGPVDAQGKATGARLRWIFNEEMRIRLIGRFQLAGFFDMGSLTNSFSAIDWSNTIRRSAGMGLRYVTPVGPIRLDYGFKLDRKAGESKGRLHFTFGYVF